MPLEDGVAPVFQLCCDYCSRPAPAATNSTDAALAALRCGFKMRLVGFQPDADFLGLEDFIKAADASQVFCPRCFQAEFA